MLIVDGSGFGCGEGSREVEGHRYANEDATTGRMVELIERGEHAVMLCHWPGMYCNGRKTGFTAFQKVVLAIAERFADQTLWMKVSEIARYEAAKELTSIGFHNRRIEFDAPLGCNDFTVEFPHRGDTAWSYTSEGARVSYVA